MKRFLMGLSAASLLILSACNQAPAPTPNGQFGSGPVSGPMPGPNPGPQPGPMPQPTPNNGGGQQTAQMVQQAVQQCIQSAGNAPQAQQVCGCFGQILANTPAEQLQQLNANPQMAQQFAMQVLQQCAGQAGGMAPGGMAPGGMGPGGQQPGGYGGMDPSMFSGALKGATGSNSTK